MWARKATGKYPKALLALFFKRGFMERYFDRTPENDYKAFNDIPAYNLDGIDYYYHYAIPVDKWVVRAYKPVKDSNRVYVALSEDMISVEEFISVRAIAERRRRLLEDVNNTSVSITPTEYYNKR